MLYLNMDEENQLLETFQTLKEKELLVPAGMFFERIRIYLEKEWGYDNPPSLNEIKTIAESFFSNDEPLKRIKAILNNDKNFSLFFNFELAAIDCIFHGKKKV